jgi:hypothetical protein
MAMTLTSTGTFLVPRECTEVPHSITLDFVFDWQSFAAVTVSQFRGMERLGEMCFSVRLYNEK